MDHEHDPDHAALRRILQACRTIAVVGLSAEWHRPSYFAAKYMQQHGYRIVPVNPKYAQILGETSYARPSFASRRTCRPSPPVPWPWAQSVSGSSWAWPTKRPPSSHGQRVWTA